MTRWCPSLRGSDGCKSEQNRRQAPVVQSPISTNPGLTLNKTYGVNPGLALIGLWTTGPRFVERGSKTVRLVEMSCPWVENRRQKEEKKTTKYAPRLRLELKRQHPWFKVRQYNIIIDILGEYSKETNDRARNMLGPLKGRDVLRRMQKAVLSSSLNMARLLKIACWTLNVLYDFIEIISTAVNS